MKTKLITVTLIFIFLSGCTTVNQYIRKITHKPNLLIGYQTVSLRPDIDPMVELLFDNNSAVIGEQAFNYIGQSLTENSYYVVEATAGGFSNQSQAIAQKRINAMIEVLESYGVKSSNIYVADYTAGKPGRQGFIYSISY